MEGINIIKEEDGYLRITIPHLGISTAAINMVDAESAILEAVLSVQIMKYKFGK